MSDPSFVSTRPTFKVNGTDRNDLMENIHTAVINSPLNGCAHAELQCLNWGRKNDSDANPDFLFGDIALGAEIEILIGQDNPTSLYKGEITAIEENFGEGNPPLISFLLQDKLHRLTHLRHSRIFESQTPDDLAQSIANAAGLQPDANIASLSADWHQLNESDLAFLMRIAGRFDVSVRVEGSQLRAKPEQPDSNPVALNTQDSILKMRVIADLNHQAQQTQVSGYNLASAEAVDFTSGGLNPAPNGVTAGATLGQLSWTSEEVMPQPFARTNAEAEAYAKAHFRRQAKRFLHGELSCVGNASLKVGKEVNIDGVSDRLKGVYQIVHCTHRFDLSSGFETHLKINRASWQP